MNQIQNNSPAIRRIRQVAIAILVCCIPITPPALSQEQGEESTREVRLKRYVEAERAKAAVGRRQATNKTSSLPGAFMVGITVWRLRQAAENDGKDTARILTQKKPGAAPSLSNQILLSAERVDPDTEFTRGEQLMLGIEASLNSFGYLYIIDREVYAGDKIGDPHLIFPARSTPKGDNTLRAGRITYIPSHKDAIPYFTLDPSRADQIGERLTIIISPRLLDLRPDNGPRLLDQARVSQWESQWSGEIEQSKEEVVKTRAWTIAEKEAGDGRRLLKQGDPLPQTVYRVKTKPGKPVVIVVSLHIKQSGQ